MAISLSSTTPRFLCASYPNKPSNSSLLPSPKSLTLTLPIFEFSPKTHLLLSGLSLSSSMHKNITSSNNNGRPAAFMCYMSSQEDAAPITNEGTEDVEDDDEAAETSDDNMWTSVETLIRYYKEAILAGDNQSVTEIEAALYRIENDRNELLEKVSSFSGEIASGKEKYIRLQADFDNFRKRSEKERLSIRSDAQGEVIESLLPMVDNFERAKQQLKPETEREKQIDTSYQGIYKQFVEIMRSLRVAAVATVGKPFDPSLHEAIAREESEEFKEGIVIQEFRRGFLLGDRLLRPAMVKVSSGPGKKKDTVAAEVLSSDQPAAAAAVEEH